MNSVHIQIAFSLIASGIILGLMIGIIQGSNNLIFKKVTPLRV
jgi:hypothetical protein